MPIHINTGSLFPPMKMFQIQMQISDFLSSRSVFTCHNSDIFPPFFFVSAAEWLYCLQLGDKVQRNEERELCLGNEKHL